MRIVVSFLMALGVGALAGCDSTVLASDFDRSCSEDSDCVGTFSVDCLCAATAAVCSDGTCVLERVEGADA